MLLVSMAARLGDLGLTPNRVAALGLNLVLLVNLAVTARLSVRFLASRSGFPPSGGTTNLPVFAVWTPAVVVILSPAFAFD
jgi:hypothetical protein